MADESGAIRAGGLQAQERVTIAADLTDGAGHRWSARAEYAADASGVVDVSKQAPVSGSYRGISAMGLIWSMKPEGHDVGIYQNPRDLRPQVIDFHLIRKGETIAEAHLDQVILAEGVQRITVHDHDLRGVLFLPPGIEHPPGVLVVGGSNGGILGRHAAWLASHGFAALALAYFRYEDLPPKLEAIPLEYFERGIAWLQRRPEIGGDRIAVLGVSRGGELALQLGSMFPAIRKVVAYVPADVRFPACCGQTDVPFAWTWKGRPLPFLRIGQRRDTAALADAKIEVEKTQGPILMISGEDDHVWRSVEMADEVAARLKRQHFPYGYENLKYAHAGHSAGRPDIIPAWHGAVRQQVSGREMDLGGSPEGDTLSSLDAMPKVLEFLHGK